MTALIVRRPGMLTTVQDLGRWGSQALGIPVGGPMDAFAHRYANALVGNEDDAAALEITLIGPELEAEGPAVCVVVGARFDVTVNGVRVSNEVPFKTPAGGRIHFGARAAGARAVLAVRGGFEVARVYGSRATSLLSRLGPFDGRALRTGDVLPVGPAPPIRTAAAAGAGLPLPEGGARLRVIEGPHEAMFDSAALEAFHAGRFVVSPQSNRMGYRLDGPAVRHAGPSDILSDATPMGSVQVPASGQPILLMADRQTTGGYPKVATVISADLPLAGQLAPGDWIEFVKVTRPEAVTALRLQHAKLGRKA